MDLTHRFSVPAPIDEAWRAFNNLESLAPCFPGATITGIEGNDFSGTVKIKLGPIALMYSGAGRYVERDTATRRVVIEARGKDKRGNGTATATVTAAFSEAGEQTEVTVSTDLAITGKPAQFGRGVISDISDKLLDQFVTCVSGQFADGLGTGPAEADTTVDSTAVTESTVAAQPVATETDPTIELGAAPEEIDGAATGVGTDRTEPTADRLGSETPAPKPSLGPSPRPTEVPRAAPSTDPERTGELNALATLGPVLLKRFGPPTAAIIVLIVIISTMIRRRR